VPRGPRPPGATPGLEFAAPRFAFFGPGTLAVALLGPGLLGLAFLGLAFFGFATLAVVFFGFAVLEGVFFGSPVCAAAFFGFAVLGLAFLGFALLGFAGLLGPPLSPPGLELGPAILGGDFGASCFGPIGGRAWFGPGKTPLGIMLLGTTVLGTTAFFSALRCCLGSSIARASPTGPCRA